MIAKLQLITIGNCPIEHLTRAKMALNFGASWIQLRLKGNDDGSWRDVAGAVSDCCKEHGATLIVNDHVWLAREVGAHGVHLGQSDSSVAQARKILGKGALIGVSTNSAMEIRAAAHDGADYVGLGPFRPTKTKENIRKILGTKGIAEICSDLQSDHIEIPIIVIGGILASDVPLIRELGAHGVAVASAVFGALDAGKAVKEFSRELEGNV